MSVIAELTIFPLDRGESVSSYVAEAVKIIRKSGLPYTTGPMGTSIEGEWHKVHDIIGKCMEEMIKHSSRVYMLVKADYREGKEGRMESKIESVKSKL